MREILRSDKITVDKLVQSIESGSSKSIVSKVGPSDTVKNIAGKQTNLLPNIVGNEFSISSIFKSNVEPK